MPRPRFEKLTARQRETYGRAVRVLGRVRDGESFSRAARAEHVSPATARKYLGSTIYETKRGEVRARAADRLVRELPFLTPEGRIERVAVRGTGRDASAVGKYWAAVKEYAETGDDRALRSLRRKTFVDATGRRRMFNIDRDTLRRLAGRGRLSFDDFGS
jgi:hypothetical protein